MPLIITNAVLGAVLVHGLVYLLTHGILADRRLRARCTTETAARPTSERERIAA